MATASFMIFRVGRALYGVETRVVQEVVWLPELWGHPSLPKGSVRVFDYHGQKIPVLDPHRWLEGHTRKLQIDDQVIVTEWEGRVVGLIAEEVKDVTSLVMEHFNDEATQTSPRHGLVGMARRNGQSIQLLDLSLMLRDLESGSSPESLDSLLSGWSGGENQEKAHSWVAVGAEGFEELTHEDCLLLRDRAHALQHADETENTDKAISLAVVRLNEEYVGFDPRVVREFIELDSLVPIPCCPDFVMGNVNLRGEVLTVFDIRSLLKMDKTSEPSLSKVAVIQVDTCLLGLAVHEVIDCVSCRWTEDISMLSGHDREPFLKNVSEYRGKSLKMLDVSHVIESGVLEVCEEG